MRLRPVITFSQTEPNPVASLRSVMMRQTCAMSRPPKSAPVAAKSPPTPLRTFCAIGIAPKRDGRPPAARAAGARQPLLSLDAHKRHRVGHAVAGGAAGENLELVARAGRHGVPGVRGVD